MGGLDSINCDWSALATWPKLGAKRLGANWIYGDIIWLYDAFVYINNLLHNYRVFLTNATELPQTRN